MIPKIDSEIGILAYTTDFSGCGGTIRNQKDDFNVSELITEKSHSRICSESGFAVYKLQKNGIDTTHALAEIFRKAWYSTKISWSQGCFCGNRTVCIHYIQN